MKRSLIISQLVVFTLGIAGTAFAATTPADENAVKVGGEVQYRYEWTADTAGSPDTFTRTRINLSAPLTDTLSFSGRIEAREEIGPDVTTPTELNVTEAYMSGKVLCFSTFILGRVQPTLGQGMLLKSDWTGIGADGLILGMGGKQVYAVVAAAKYNTLNVQAANLSFDLFPDTNLSVAYLQDIDGAKLKNTAVGFNYRGIQDLKISGEYGSYASEATKAANDDEAGNSWFIAAQYRGADPAINNSYGLWVGYMSTDKGVGLPYTADLSSYQNGTNLNGIGIGANWTLFKNGIMSMQYNMVELKTTNTDSNSLVASLNYKF